MISTYRVVPFICVHLWCPFGLSHGNDIRFVCASSFLWEGSRLSYVICVCLCIVVSNTYCVRIFCFIYIRLVYPRLPVALDCLFLITSLTFCIVYFHTRRLSTVHTGTDIILNWDVFDMPPPFYVGDIMVYPCRYVCSSATTGLPKFPIGESF